MAPLAVPSAAATDAGCIGLEIVFKAVFKPAAPVFFSGPGHKYPGICDGVRGVQWSAWHNHKTGVVELAVNLEGIDYDGYPVGRLIDRELKTPKLPSLAESIASDVDLTVAWYRDPWNPYRNEIKEDTIIAIPAQHLTRQRWREALVIARECLTPDLLDRATQWVTYPHAGRRHVEVSPHFQVLTPVWRSMPEGHPARVARMQTARDLLRPFHELSTRLAAP